MFNAPSIYGRSRCCRRPLPAGRLPVWGSSPQAIYLAATPGLPKPLAAGLRHARQAHAGCPALPPRSRTQWQCRWDQRNRQHGSCRGRSDRSRGSQPLPDGLSASTPPRSNPSQRRYDQRRLARRAGGHAASAPQAGFFINLKEIMTESGLAKAAD